MHLTECAPPCVGAVRVQVRHWTPAAQNFQPFDTVTSFTQLLTCAQVPFMFKYAIDGLTLDPSGATAVGPMLALTPAALIAAYGAARAGSALCNELRNATFAKVVESTLG